MTEKTLPKDIFVISGPAGIGETGLVPRRGPITSRLLNVSSVDITNLQGQVNIFLQQMGLIMADAPEKVGSFQLAEFEVSAALLVEAKGGVRLALLANAEVGGSVNVGLKFVFKRS